MQLHSVKNITGEIDLLSGLHIGAGNAAMEIGGLDQPIIKHPLTNEPYIPGSSLKGKMRSLLEMRYNRLGPKGNPCQCAKSDCPVCPLFGVSGAQSEQGSTLGPTRLLVRDANLNKHWQGIFRQGDLPMEVKYENLINRIRGVAEHPRPLERVPAGVRFELALSLRIFDASEEERFLSILREGLALVQLDALGGCGSRGCGQIRFDNLQVDGNPISQDDLTQALQSQKVA
ncbi:MAG: type III-A CRISPR-associated RAMP protein Csm3 [Desulfovermiculus sp.]